MLLRLQLDCLVDHCREKFFCGNRSRGVDQTRVFTEFEAYLRAISENIIQISHSLPKTNTRRIRTKVDG